MMNMLKRRLFRWACAHTPAYPKGASAVIRQTAAEPDGGVNRRAFCAMCGATWERIPARDKFNPGRP